MARIKWLRVMAACGLTISFAAAAQTAAPTGGSTTNPYVGEVIPLIITGWPKLSFDLALEAARKAVQVCSAHKTGIVVEVFGADGGLRVMLASDGPVNTGAETEAQDNAAKARQSGIPVGGAFPLKRGDVQRGVISVAGAWDNGADNESPTQDIACAKAGLDAIKNRL